MSFGQQMKVIDLFWPLGVIRQELRSGEEMGMSFW